MQKIKEKLFLNIAVNQNAILIRTEEQFRLEFFQTYQFDFLKVLIQIFFYSNSISIILKQIFHEQTKLK